MQRNYFKRLLARHHKKPHSLSGIFLYLRINLRIDSAIAEEVLNVAKIFDTLYESAKIGRSVPIL